MRTPRPVHMVSDALFAPADGLLYTEEDYDRVHAQQPLEDPELPEYLIPDNTCTLKPPVLHYGWKIGYEKMMAIVTERFPDMVEVRLGPDIWDDDDPRWSEDIPEEEWSRMQPSPSATLYNQDLTLAICRHLGIPEKVAQYITVHEFVDADGRDAGLSVGTNYAGILKESHCAKLQMMFSPNEEPKWYLDETVWQWRREALAQKSSRKRPAA